MEYRIEPVERALRRAPGAQGCAFTGYRPAKMAFGYNEADARCVDFKLRLRAQIERLIMLGYAHFLSGGAMGMDIWGAEAALALREAGKNITLEIVSPFDGQADRWTSDYRERRARLIEAADVYTVISHEYTPSCLFRRNRYIVQNAALILAAYDGQEGGTKMTIETAYREGVPVLTIPPVIQKARKYT